MKKMADVWRENDVLVKRILGDERILVDAWVRGNLVIPSSVEPRKERKFLAPMLQGFSAHRYGWKMILEGENGARMVLRYCPGEWNVKAFLEDPPTMRSPHSLSPRRQMLRLCSVSFPKKQKWRLLVKQKNDTPTRNTTLLVCRFSLFYQ